MLQSTTTSWQRARSATCLLRLPGPQALSYVERSQSARPAGWMASGRRDQCCQTRRGTCNAERRLQYRKCLVEYILSTLESFDRTMLVSHVHQRPELASAYTFFLCLRQASQPRPEGTPGIFATRCLKSHVVHKSSSKEYVGGGRYASEISQRAEAYATKLNMA